MQEVSRGRSTKRLPFQRNLKLRKPFGKDRIHHQKLNPHYVAGFIDGEGSFSVSIGKHKTLRRGLEIRPEFELELRADDRKILERLLITIGCGKIYDCSYDRYGWYPHTKYKVTSTKDMEKYLFPFLDRYPLQAKKSATYKLFREIVLMVRHKKHLSDQGFKKILNLRKKIRKMGKKHKWWKPPEYGKTVRSVVSGVRKTHYPDTARHFKEAGNTGSALLGPKVGSVTGKKS